MESHHRVDAVTLGRQDDLSISRQIPRNGNNRNMSLMQTTDNRTVAPNFLRIHNRPQQNIYTITGSQFQLGNIYYINKSEQVSNHRRSTSCSTPERSTSIDAMMRSNEPINENIMDIISDHLGENWRFLFRKLGYSTGRIDQVAEDYYRNNKEQIYRLLLDYTRNNDDACLGHIIRIMWKNGFRECCVILKEPWKRGELFSNTTIGETEEEILNESRQDE